VVWVPGLEGADVLFLARDGIRSLRRAENDVQTGAGLPLSYQIPGWIERINFDFAHKAVAAVHNNKYHLAVPMDGAEDNTHILRFDLFQNSWILFDIRARDLGRIPFNGEDRLYFQNTYRAPDCSSTGLASSATETEVPFQVYRAYSGSMDPGASQIDYSITTRALHLNNLDVRKRWDQLAIMGTVEAGATHTMLVEYRVDFKDWTTAASLTIAVPDPGIHLGVDALPWVRPDQQLVIRKLDLRDVDPGYIIQFRFSDELDYGRPTFNRVVVRGEHEQRIFSNDEV
jgi:hypothetical protein